MRLSHISIASIIACLAGLTLLIWMAVHMMDNIRTKQAEMKQLLELDQRVGALKVASIDLLLYYPEPDLKEAFEQEARAIQGEFLALEEIHPGASRVGRYIDLIKDILDVEHKLLVESGPLGQGPLNLSQRSQILLGQMAGHGAALEGAVSGLLEQREAAITERVNWTVAVFALVAVVFGALCVMAFLLIHRRLAGPVQAMSKVVQRLAQGDTEARVAIHSHDELSDLGDRFNRLLDDQEAAESERDVMFARLRDQEVDLRHSRDLMVGALRTTRALIDSLPANIALLDGEGDIVQVNELWRRFARDNELAASQEGMGANYLSVCQAAAKSGDEDAAIMEQAIRQVLSGELPGFSHEYPCHSPEKERWFRVTVNPLSDSRDENVEGGAVVMHLDITERRQAEQHLNRLAFQDLLTQVASRSGFAAQLESGLTGPGWDPQGIVVILDLINLRQVNDANGFDVGDQLLQAVAGRLLEAVGEGGIVGRAGGDEFMIYMPGNGADSSTFRHERLHQVFQNPFQISSYPIEMSARFGYTDLDDRPRSVGQLLREAELALFQGSDRYSANCWGGYTAELDRKTRERVQLTEELREALRQDQFELHYQPKVDIRTGQIVSAEALIRWQHPERGLVSPGVFIPVAEQGQLIGPIGDWVMDRACRSVRAWRDEDLNVVPVSINVSLEQFSLGRFREKVNETMGRNRVTSEDLVLEITESVFERETEGVLCHLKSLHGDGLRLSLDDFGTGYSSLLYLQKYPFDEIKVDRGFVNGMLDDGYSREIVETVIGLARAIGADVVAEGVETLEQGNALLAMGCQVAQGFYYSKPLPESEFRALLASGRTLPID